MAEKNRKLLPLLGNGPAPEDVPRWHDHDGGVTTLARYAGSLLVGGVDAPPQRLKSVPTPWARLVVFEHALFEDDHPAHTAVVQEWRGMLGCLALQEYERFEVEATGVDLDGERGVLPDLRGMLEEPGEERWARLGLVRVDGALVGGTSPRTLVFTGIRGDAARTSVPWQKEGRLTDPAEHYYGHQDKRGLALLNGWLAEVLDRYRNDGRVGRHLDELLGTRPAPETAPGPERSDAVLQELETWREDRTAAMLEELGGATGDGPLDRVEMGKRAAPVARAFHRGTPAHDVYSVLVPVPYEGQRDNDLRLRHGQVVLDPGRDGLIVESDGRPYTGKVRLAAGGVRQVQEGRLAVSATRDQLGEPVVDPSRYFADGLVEVEDVERENASVLEGDVDYLYPFHAEVMEPLRPADVTRTEIVEERPGGVRVRLELPLERDGLRMRYDRVYERGDVLDGFASPELAIWPDLAGEAWDWYFWFRRRVGREGTDELEVVPAPTGTEERKADAGGDANGEPAAGPAGTGGGDVGTGPRRDVFEDEGHGFTWGRTDRPVRAWTARAHRTSGLIFTNVDDALERVDSTPHEWDVSVDFGSTHTRVYRRESTAQGDARPAIVSFASRAVPLFKGVGLLPVCFFPAPGNEVGSREEPRSLVQLPVEKIPAGRGKKGFPRTWLPADGIVYWRSLLAYRVPDGLRTNLKWHEGGSEDEWAFQSYQTQLYLMTAAEAAAAEQPATLSSITPAFPSVFTNALRTRHGRLWDEVAGRFGVRVEPAMMESVALAEYLTHGPGDGTPAANLLAVDVGGSTADVAAWSGSEGQLASDSVRMAGGLMTRLLGTDEAAREAVRRAAAGPGIRLDLTWSGDPVEDGLRFAALLRHVEREEGSIRGLADNMYDGRGSAGERVIAHAGYLYAVLSYLLGLMVRRAGLAPDPDAGAPTYHIHFGGHGSGFLRWLDALGAGTHRKLPETFFLAALGAEEPARVKVSLSDEHAKEEVGQGILLASEEAWVRNRELSDQHHSTFLGESGLPERDGEALDWSSTLTPETLGRLAEPDRPLPLASYAHLMRFLEPFRGDERTLAVIGDALQLRGEVLDDDLRRRLHQRLYGTKSPWSRWRTYREHEGESDDGDRRPDLLLEPFFVTEARTLLEHATGNPQLFGT